MKAIILTILTALAVVGACSQLQKPEVIEIEGDPPRQSCGELTVGQTKTETCEGGTKVFVCKTTGLEEILNSCKVVGGDCVTFEEIKPILSKECVLCHFTPAPYDRYEVATAKIDSFIRRQNLGKDNPERMPKEPRPPMSAGDKALIERWKSDGLKENPADCSGGGATTGFINLFNLESAIILDLAKLESDDRENARYIVATHKINEGKADNQIPMAIDKTFNSVSNDDELSRAEEISPGIFRVDLRSYGFDGNDWQEIEDADKFDLESFTDEGIQIKFLTGARKAWLHYDNVVDITQQAVIYYDLINVASNLNQHLRNIGVNAQAQFADFSAQFLGFNGSEISLQKNRLIVRFEGEDGYAWITFDTIPPLLRERNVFEFPCLNGTGCNALYDFAASEIIWTLPNGMQGYALFDSAGNRQDNAAIELGIVQDTRSPLDPQIDNAIDCHRCHQKGILPATDEVRDHVIRNGSLFTANDRNIILELYKSQEANNAIFATDNAIFNRAMVSIGVDQNTKDQMNDARDNLKLDWDISEVAGFLFLTVDEFKTGLQGSGQGSQAIGQLLTGGRITFDQFIDILPVLKKDLLLFQEPL